MSDKINDAVKNGDAKRVCFLLEQGTNVNEKEEFGWTPLLTAVQRNRVDIVHLLLEKGADPCLRKDNGCSPFILAAITGNVDMLELFLEKGSDINDKDSNGFTALMEAAVKGHEKAAIYLLDKGADVNLGRAVTKEQKSLCKGGETALMDAAKFGHENIIILLLSYKANVNACDHQGRSPLLHAFSKPKQTKNSVICILLESGAEANVKDLDGKTPLIHAAKMDRLDLVKSLLDQNGIEINTIDNAGTTALSEAVENDSYEIAKLLLEKGARPEHEHIQKAERKYSMDLVELLCQYGGSTTGNRVPENWKPRSKRWGGKLIRLNEIDRPLIGKLKIFINEEYKIHETSKGGIYLGLYNGQEVAVKRIPTCDKKELLCLQQFQKNNHLVRFYAAEEEIACLYLCLFLYEGNLEEHISNIKDITEIQDILKSIFLGLHELHEIGFCHRDLHPSNILIDLQGKTYLADFSESLKLEDSFEAKQEQIKSDMKALANLVLYVVTRGEASFQPDDEMDIKAACPDTVEDFEEARDLINKLISPNEYSSVTDFCKHPFFWSHNSRYRFLQDVGNESDLKSRVEDSQLFKSLKNSEVTKTKTFDPWMSGVDQEILDDMNGFYTKRAKNKNKKYYQDTVTDLLKFIRNMGAHFDEKPEKIKKIIGDPCQYFLKTFPDLTVYVYETLRQMKYDKHFPKPSSSPLKM
ncbi:2-5A-dependent ribonuclease [Rhinatrema bivittatum]|uniref:2-5A-dependent ribonuclease n=1 Tax=Rhinatrema bivittatum TaxID=194408 RepID=UPI0011266A99|nr:2-5A-dependent ribonuclease [Rhinatrema bivittatum]XP_029474448.1 2-5A-dependent ribonuclease [Rhinatrema bivittatum]